MSTRSLGILIRIYLAEGSPAGLKFIEKSNWSGYGFVCPRPRFQEVKTRDEFKKAGVYVLVGPAETGDLPSVYVGEGDPIKSRLERHSRSDNDFWNFAYGFVSKDSNLHKAHIQYLEARLLTLLRDANRCVLKNVNSPAEPSLSEADRDETEGFLQEMLLCFPVLGVNIFEKPERRATPKHLFYLKNKGVYAVGYESADGFVVKKGATAVDKLVESAPPNSIPIRNGFLEQGILIFHKPGYYRLTQDYKFSSPSIAAGTLIGANISGRDAWKTAQGRTLKELQDSGSS